MTRTGAVFEGAWGGMRKGGVAGACVLLDGKSFSSGGGDAATDSGGCDEVVFCEVTRRGSMRATGCVGILRADIGSIPPYCLSD